MMSPEEKVAGSKIYMHLPEAVSKDAYAKSMELLMMDTIIDLLKILCNNSEQIMKLLGEVDVKKE